MYNENDFFSYDNLSSKVITFHDSEGNDTFGFNVCNFQKSATEENILTITFLNGTVSLTFGDSTAAKLAHNLLVIATDQLAVNCTVGSNLPEWVKTELNYLALSGPIPLWDPIDEEFRNEWPPLYRSYKAVLSQSAPQTLTSGTLIVGAKYIITSFVAGDDFTNVGAAANINGTEFIATGDTPANWSNSSTIDSFGEPVAQVLYNTIGEVVWTYVSAGRYLATCTNGFTIDKTVVEPPKINFNQFMAFGSFNLYGYSIIDGDSFYLYSAKHPNAGSTVAADSLINLDTIEIRVYQ